MKGRLGTILASLLLACSGPEAHATEENRIVIESDGWELVGDLHFPDSDVAKTPAVLMLNQAAGDRTAYVGLTEHLTARGVAALRLDLPGHGESTNLGRFVPGEVPRSPMIWDAEKSIISAHRFLKDHPRIDAEKIGIVGASYSGEEAAEAGRLSGYAQAYVVLSPGSFGNESIASIDTSEVPWLFVASRDERFLQEITAEIRQKSVTAERIIIPGNTHASDILVEHSGVAERIAVWLDQHLCN